MSLSSRLDRVESILAADEVREGNLTELYFPCKLDDGNPPGSWKLIRPRTPTVIITPDDFHLYPQVDFGDGQHGWNVTDLAQMAIVDNPRDHDLFET